MVRTQIFWLLPLVALVGMLGCSPGAPGSNSNPSRPGPKHPLVGRPMPAFEVKLLDGATLRSADLQGRVVVLDFWATWCGPCVASLPKIAATTERYRDRGVVFYAVNLQERPQVVESFLSKQGLQVPVALDTNGLLGGLFEVSSIPQTVIIDREGKVRVVHIGARPDVGDVLAADLDKILAAPAAGDSAPSGK